jgi:hypothetical protein
MRQANRDTHELFTTKTTTPQTHGDPRELQTKQNHGELCPQDWQHQDRYQQQQQHINTPSATTNINLKTSLPRLTFMNQNQEITY